MVTAMLVVPAMDAIAKVLTADLSPFQIGFLRYAIQTLLLALVLVALALVRRRAFAVPRTALPKLALAGVFMGSGIGSLIWALTFLPLANAIAIFFVEPLILTLFSALFLRETIGLHRLSAVAVGLLGAVIVIRPNWALFGWASVLPLVSALSYAALLTTIRSITAHLDGLRVQFYSGAFAGLFLGLALFVGNAAAVPVFTWSAPAPTAWGLLLVLGVTATITHFMITIAFKTTQASILAPFQYLEIISATLLGYLVFGDFPDALTWLGTAIILSAGGYVFHRERQHARHRRRVALATTARAGAAAAERH